MPAPTKPSRPWWKKLLLFAAFALVTVITIAALALSWISFQSRRDWAKTKADLLARGEKLSLVELVPSPIPDEQNFFGDPMWKELADVVDTVGGDGIHHREPRLHKGRRRIDAIAPPLPPELIDRAKALLRPGPSNSVTGWDVARNAIAQLDKATDPAAQRELAQFTLDALASGLPARKHIEMLLDRPDAVYPHDYSQGFASLPLDHIQYLLEIAQIYGLSARAHLTLGEAAPAAADTATQLRLADTVSTEPLLISLLVQMSILSQATSIIDHGISEHRWRDAELAGFERKLASIHLPLQLANALRGERGGANQFIQILRKGGREANIAFQQFTPSPGNSSAESAMVAKLLQFAMTLDQPAYNRFVQQYVDALGQPGGVSPASLPVLKKEGATFLVFHMLTSMAAPSFESSAPRVIFAQDSILKTRIACALERYRLQHGSYPDSLDALVPAFLPAIPSDALAGQKLHYRLDGPDKFRLWSVGWNETDEGGARSLNRQDYQTADWVWNEPPGPKR